MGRVYPVDSKSEQKIGQKNIFGGMKKDNLIIWSQMLYTQDEKIKTNMHIFQQSNKQDFHR